MRAGSTSVRVCSQSMTAFTGVSKSPRIGRSYSASPCPGPSNASVAMPRAWKGASYASISSFVESRPEIMITTGSRASPPGVRSTPASIVPAKGMATRSPGGRRYGSASVLHSTAFACAASQKIGPA